MALVGRGVWITPASRRRRCSRCHDSSVHRSCHCRRVPAGRPWKCPHVALTESVTAPTVAVSTAPRGHTKETTGGRLPETGGAARASKRLRRARAPLAAVTTLIGVLLGPGFVTASAAAEAPGDVLRLAVVVDLEHPVSGADADDLGRSLAAFVAARGPAVALDAASPDRLRLTVS